MIKRIIWFPGEEKLSQATDVYAFGICALEVCVCVCLCVCFYGTVGGKLWFYVVDVGT